MTQKALKLALEALETPWNAPYVDGCDLALGKKVKAITAIKEALAEPNFCPRCGKRLGTNNWDIHTCTPPQRTEQLKACVYCGQLVAKKRNT